MAALEGPHLRPKAAAVAIKRALAALLKATGKYGGVPAKLADERSILSSALEDLVFALRHPETPTETPQGIP